MAAYNDFRKIIDRSDIDAVAIVTPDHWHCAMTVMAAKAGKDIFCQNPMFTTALRCGYRLRYANGVELIQQSDDTLAGTRFESTKGWALFSFQDLQTHPESLKTSKIGPNEIHLPKPVEYADDRRRDHYADHVRIFLDCVKTRTEPIEPVEVGHRTASLCHLANIALRLNKTLKWDPEKECFPEDAQANQMLSRPIREPW